MAVQMTVIFKATDAEKLLEAVASFASEIKESVDGRAGFSLSTDGWSYECREQEAKNPS